MGNYASSCVLPAPPHATLLDPEGPPRRVEIPACAAELMLEAPGHVVVPAEELRRTRRASGMPADKPLRAGAVYLLLPVDKIGSRLSDRQMEVVLRATEEKKKMKKKKGGKAKRTGSGKRVFPEVAGKEAEEKGFLDGAATGKADPRFRRHRPWRPVLETIPESH